MKADDIAKQKAKDWLILGGKLVTRILKDTDLLTECLKIREELGWTNTNLGELYSFIS